MVAILSGLSGCGFAPLYAPQAGGAPRADLAKVFVAVIPDRPGQLLRQALQVRLEGTGGSPERLYTLTVTYGVSGEYIGINPDTSASFARFKATANWSLLSALSPGAPPLATGFAFAQDGYSIIVNQYFYTDLYTQTLYRRFANTIADQIVLRLATYFRNREKVAAK